jgi:hypothetical protein
MVNYYEERYKNKKESISNVDLLVGLVGAIGTCKTIGDISSNAYHNSGVVGKVAIITSNLAFTIASFGIISSVNSIARGSFEGSIRKVRHSKVNDGSNVIPFSKEGE